MLIVVVFTVNRNMPNLTAIEVAKAHLAAKDAAREKEKEDAGKRKGKEDQTGKKVLFESYCCFQKHKYIKVLIN